MKKDMVSYKEHVWNHLLGDVFLSESIRSMFLNSKVILALEWDEIPVQPVDLALVGELRDELKIIEEIVIILSGTNSKAANMIGLSSGKASFSEGKDLGECWSYLVTRMPRFVPDISPYFEFWSDLKNKSISSDELQSVVSVISISINGNGNPRLINLAIAALSKVHLEATPEKPFSFEDWQHEFTKKNIVGKFAVLEWSDGSEILKAQVNLLLAASSKSSLADAIIHRHYGFRAFPDRGENGCCVLASKNLEAFGGWLRHCPRAWRCMGRSLYSGDVDAEKVKASHVDWQVTVFQTVCQDILLYLGSCWAPGYFAVFQRDSASKGEYSTQAMTSLQIVTAYWESNALGPINFQNPQVPINTGAMLEILVALSVMNAAAISQDRDFFTFFDQLLSQLDIQCSSSTFLEIRKDKAFEGIQIPRYIFPGTASDWRLNKIGILERTANSANIDAILHGVEGENALGTKVQKICFEAKQRKSLDATDVMTVIKKILKKDGDIGIMFSSNTSSFELTADGAPNRPLANLRDSLSGQKTPSTETAWSKMESNLGVGYFVTVDHLSRGGILPFTFNEEKKGRFILINLPGGCN